MKLTLGKRDAQYIIFEISLLLIFMLLYSAVVHAQPIGPTITIYANETKQLPGGTLVNSSVNGTVSPGGLIFTATLDSQQQNSRWKAYVGNVTGSLVLDDASDNTVFAWTLTTVTGEVYASRSSNVNWTGVNCTWAAEGVARYNESNRTVEELENAALSHTFLDDNITATFEFVNHSSLTIGSVVVGKDECFAIQTNQRDAAQVFPDSDQANFTQVILYDGTNTTNGNVVYVTEIENDNVGYRSTSTYDFQMLVPENGGAGFTSSTAYYFYVELA